MERRLASERCEACRPGAPRVRDDELPDLLAAVPDWERTVRDGSDRLRRAYRFPDFASALEFTARAGALAEAEDHHPTITLRWGRVTVSWWTHVIAGLHRNDFRMAAKCDAIYREMAPAGGVAPAG